MWYCPYCLESITKELQHKCLHCHHDLEWETIEYTDKTKEIIMTAPHNPNYMQFPYNKRGSGIDSKRTSKIEALDLLKPSISDV